MKGGGHSCRVFKIHLKLRNQQLKTITYIAKAWKQPNVHQQMNGQRRFGIYIYTHTQWNITQPQKE